MNLDALLMDFRRRGLRVWPEGGKLVVAPAELLTDDDRETIRRYKPDLLALLKNSDEGAQPAARERWAGSACSSMPLRRCGALVCRGCHTHGPSPHREGCTLDRFEACGSRWFWLSPHGAVKCVACSTPADLGLVEAWVLSRETGEGADGWRIPAEIFSALHTAGPPQ